MTYVIAGMSHKGGTGRSVTLANLAYHLYIAKSSVLIVDLDLASATMGSILELAGIETGRKGRDRPNEEALNVTDVLEDTGKYGTKSLIDVRRSSRVIKNIARNDLLFQLMPGSISDGDWRKAQHNLNKAIEELIINLRGGSWDYILLDIRSGLSDVLEALGNDENGLIDLALLHFRWTSQHLASLKQLIADNRLNKRHIDSIRFVRTAKANIDDSPEFIRPFIKSEHHTLLELFREIEFGGQTLHEESKFLIGDIGFDPRLRWKELILPKNKTNEEDPSNLTYQQFSTLARNVQSLFYR